MNLEEAMHEIREQVKVCRSCTLCATRRNAVPGEGPVDAEVMFIGEAPGFHENEQGKPFVGQAGKLLDTLLEAAGLERGKVFITNVVKCRPPLNRDPEPQELVACANYLDKQIALINPKIIVTLGRFSMGKFIEGGRISAIHGKAHQVKDHLVVTMYHPAAALHQPALKGSLLADFAHLRQLLGHAAKPEQSSESNSQTSNAKINKAEVKKEEEKDNTPEQLSLF